MRFTLIGIGALLAALAAFAWVAHQRIVSRLQASNQSLQGQVNDLTAKYNSLSEQLDQLPNANDHPSLELLQLRNEVS